MAYSLSYQCAKNLCKRAVLVHIIIENVVTFFVTQCSLTSHSAHYRSLQVDLPSQLLSSL